MIVSKLHHTITGPGDFKLVDPLRIELSYPVLQTGAMTTLAQGPNARIILLQQPSDSTYNLVSELKLVAEPGIAPGTSAYEADKILFLYPAKLLRLIIFRL